MRNFRERLDYALKQKGLNQAEFARQMKTEPQNVNLWKVRGGIPRAHFIKACELLGVNPAWLSDGKTDAATYEENKPFVTTNQISDNQEPIYSKDAGAIISEEEREFLNLIKQLDPEDRARLRAVGRAFIKPTEKANNK